MLTTELTSKALFGDEEGSGIALVPSQEEEEGKGLPVEDLSFVDEVFPGGGERIQLPLTGSEYPRAVKDLIRDVSSDRLYVIPPYGRLRDEPSDVREVLRDKYGRLADWAAITLLSVLEVLSENQKAALMLPKSLFGSRSSRRFRAQSLDLGHPELIFEPLKYPLGSSLLQVQTVIYSGAGDQEGTPLTRFFSIPEAEEAEKQAVLDDFQQLLRQGGGETTYGFVHRGALDPEDTWTYQSLNPELERDIKEVEEIGEVRPLEELFEIRVGRPLPKDLQEEIDQTDRTGGNREVPLLEARDIRTDGSLAYGDTRRNVSQEDISENNLVRVKDGDICLRQVSGSREGVVAGEVKEYMTPLVGSPNVIVLRPKDDLSREDREVVLQYLRSDTATRYLRAKGLGTGHLRIEVGRLRDLPVPSADDDLRGALRSLMRAADLFGKWKDEALEAARSLFDHPTAEDGKMHVLTTGRRSRQRHRAAERVDELSYRVQTQFPHPVAYRWRMVAAAKPNLEGYSWVLECSEILACYLAQIAITLAREVEEEIGYLEQMGKRIVQGRGTNMGDWIAILREVRDSKSFRQLSDDETPFYEVMHFMPEGQKADEALSQLKKRRDRNAHGKGPRGNEVPSAFETARDQLLSFLGAAEFLSDYPLRYVEDTKANTIRNRVRYRYRDVMGDHPLVPLQEGATELMTLEAESLYLVDRSGSVYLLRPLLDRRRCPVCGTWSTFYLDSYDDTEGACVLKSMEHGHTAEDEEIHRAFQKTGILP